MYLRETEALMATLKSLAIETVNEQFFWLGCRLESDHIEVMQSERVPVVQNPTSRRAGCLIDETEDRRIVKMLESENLQLVSIHNHPASMKKENVPVFLRPLLSCPMMPTFLASIIF